MDGGQVRVCTGGAVGELQELVDPREPDREAGALTVGFAGIGRMGAAMARNLLAAGVPLIVWNRTAERCTPLLELGARIAAEPAALAAADVVVTMVSDAQAARSVLIESGLLDALRSGSVVLEMSTIGPVAAASLAAEALQRGVRLLDAPVSGSVPVAEAAQLFAMVGGERDAYERAAPVLDAMTKGHVLLGPSGAGAAMKVAVNAMIAVTNESLAETLALAEQFGIPRALAYDVLAGGALASPFVLYKREAFLQPDTAPVAFTTALMRKDTSLAQELAARLGVRIPAADAAAGMLDEAHESGLADADIASVFRLLGPQASHNHDLTDVP
jgi:3-hydroxyisobutyrate dehydrogenase-like beta-hydroxyacid dehydrogenase